MLTIHKSDITMVEDVDEDPDTSFLGEYSRTPGAADRTIDRKERGDMQRGEYRYFIAAMSGAETGNPESVLQFYKEMEAINQGEVCFHVVRACVTLRIPTGNGDCILQKIQSPGVWGIQSDFDAVCFAEVFADETSILVDMLAQLGVTVID